ncbi:MAG: MG2 domain-containing protein [Planctomycetota bacterium]|nr:MG2 domain-containing protein [Planctomycetota bacterium]
MGNVEFRDCVRGVQVRRLGARLDSKACGAVRVGGVLLALALVAVNAAGWAWYGTRAQPANVVAASEPQRRAELRVAALLPTREIETAERLSVQFTEPVCDTLPLPELGVAPFRLEPPHEGHWEWEGNDTLAFVLATPLCTGQSVEFVPTPALEELARRPLAAGEPLRFSAGNLEFTGARLRSADPDHVNIEVSFNTAVAAERLVGQVRIEQPPSKFEDPIEPEVLSTGASELHTLRFPRPQWTKFTVIVPAGVVPANGPLATLGERSFELELPTAFTWTSHWTSVDSASESVSVVLYFDRELALKQEAPPVKVEPAVTPLTVRPGGTQLLLEGNFECGRTYSITVGASLLAVDGGSLGKDVRREVEIGHRSPYISLPRAQGILTPTGGLALELATTNVSAVQVVATRLLPGNLVPHLRGERTAYTSKELFSRTYPLPLEPDRPQKHALDLRALLERQPDGLLGIFELEVRSTESRWTSDRTVVHVTDIGTTLKRDSSGLHVWLRSLSSGAALAGARVSALSIADQLLASATTDADGYAALPLRIANSSERPYVVLAEHGQDLGYLELGENEWNVPEALAAGRAAPRSADVFAYTERGLYRPGDTVHVTGIARTPLGAVLTSELRAVVERPDGRVWLDTTVKPELAQGTFHLDVPTELDSPTGQWQVRVHVPGNDEVVGRARFGVETFLAARLVLNLQESSASSAENLSLGVQPLALCAVANFPVQMKARWIPEEFRSQRFPHLRFRRSTDDGEPVLANWSGNLDEEGNITAPAPGLAELKRGKWTGMLEWTVTEPGSRSVTSRQTLSHDSSPFHLGLAFGAEADAPPAYVIATGAPTTVRWACVDPKDLDVAAPRFEWRLETVKSETVLARVSGVLTWQTEENVEVVATGLIEGSGASSGTFDITCSASGRHRLTLAPEGGDETRLDFHATHGPVATFVPPLEDQETIVLQAPQGPFRPGDTFEIELRTPFDGSLLVTLEDQRLLAQQRVATERGEAKLRFEIPADARGSVIVSAQVTRAIERGASWRPHRAYGWLKLDLERTSHEIALKLEAPERVDPGESASVRVELAEALPGARPAVVHLFAVDEGIRVTGGDRRPEPAAFFLAPRRHSTPTGDVWAALLPDHLLPESIRRIGGDVDLGLESARRGPPQEVRRTPAVVWQQAVEFDSTRARTFELAVPDFVGTLTWIAVAVDGDRYGSSEARTRVRGEVPMSLNAPRFAAPGDRFVVPVVLENGTDLPAQVALSLELDGPADFVRELDAEGLELATNPAPVEASATRDGQQHAHKLASVPLAPGATLRRWLEFEATGEGRLEGRALAIATLEGGRDVPTSARLDVPVRSGRPEIVAERTLVFGAGQPRSIEIAKELGIVKEELLRASVRVSSNVSTSLEPLGRYALSYPYGCAEQTTSRIAALLALPHSLLEGEELEQDANARIAAGIDRLWSMQTRAGGIAYWNDDREPSLWASVYVAETLVEAKRRGHDVPKDLLDGLAQYLERAVARDCTPSARASLVRALAELGRPQRGWERRLEELRNELDACAEVELALTAALDGRPEDARRRLAERDAAKTGGRDLPGTGFHDGFRWLHSDVRRLALELRTRLTLGDVDAGLVDCADALDGARHGQRYGSTLDNGSALLALARYHELVAATPSDWSGTLQVGTDVREIRSGEELRLDAGHATTIDLNTEGSGRTYVAVRGVGRRSADAPAVDSGLRVRRRWLDLEGKELDPNAIRLGTLVQVELSVVALGSKHENDVAIVDPLPAGFEIENERLANTGTGFGRRRPGPATVALAPTRVEYLDDRAVVFASAWAVEAHWSYRVRAVALGTFEHAPPSAESMYDATVSSVGGPATKVTVVP